MSLQSDNCNDITNSLLCTPIIWNHSGLGAADVFLETE